MFQRLIDDIGDGTGTVRIRFVFRNPPPWCHENTSLLCAAASWPARNTGRLRLTGGAGIFSW